MRKRLKTKKTTIEVEGGMTFFKWLYLGIVLMRIAGVIDWPWQWIFAPVVIIVVVALLIVLWPGKGGNAKV